MFCQDSPYFEIMGLSRQNHVLRPWALAVPESDQRIGVFCHLTVSYISGSLPEVFPVGREPLT